MITKKETKYDVGFLGYAGAGKNTAAGALVDEGWTEVSFATPLKALCRVLGWDGIKDAKGRKLLQEIGCALRHYDPDYWIKQADELNKLEEGPYVWTDVRFPNEAALIKQRQGTLIRIDRPDLELTDVHKDESESHVATIQVDKVLINDGSMGDLRQKVTEYFNES